MSIHRVVACSVFGLGLSTYVGAAVDASFAGGTLELTISGGGNCVVTASGGNVQVNGTNPLVGGVPTVVAAADVFLLQLLGDSNANAIDCTGVTSAAGFTSLPYVWFKAGAGDDTLHGSPDVLNEFDPDEGDDHVWGGAHIDDYEWNQGGGSDVVDLGAGFNMVTLSLNMSDGADRSFSATGTGATLEIEMDSPSPPQNAEIQVVGGCAHLTVYLASDTGNDTVVFADSIDGAVTDEIEVWLGDGDDSCTFVASPTIAYTLDGGGHGSGDIVNLDLEGRAYTLGPGAANVAGCQAINWTTVEQVNLLNPGLPVELDSFDVE